MYKRQPFGGGSACKNLTTAQRGITSVLIKHYLVLAACIALAACDDGSSDRSSTTSTSTVSSTVTSTSTSTSSTRVLDTTTSTSMGGDPCGCVVTFGVTNAETLGSLQYDTDYSASGGGFDGAAGTVACQRVTGDFAAFNDIETSQTLSSAFVSVAGFTGPTTIATCDFTGSNPTTDDFAITITDQAKPDFSSANATVAVTDVTCTCVGSTSTTTSTTIGGG